MCLSSIRAYFDFPHKRSQKNGTNTVANVTFSHVYELSRIVDNVRISPYGLMVTIDWTKRNSCQSISNLTPK